MGSSYAAYLDMAAYTDIFASSTVTFIPHPVTYSDRRSSPAGDRGEHVGLVPDGAWTATRARTLVHRGRGRDERAPVVVLGYRAWTTRFASDPAVVGRIIRIDGMPVTVVGVGPANHAASMNFGAHTDFWMPLRTLVAFGGAAADVRARCLRAGVHGQSAPAARRHRGAGAGGDDDARLPPGARVPQGRQEGRDQRLRLAGRADSPADGRHPGRIRHGAPGDRRARARHRLQQPGHAAARARRRQGEGSVGAPGRRRHTRRSSCVIC